MFVGCLSLLLAARKRQTDPRLIFFQNTLPLNFVPVVAAKLCAAWYQFLGGKKHVMENHRFQVWSPWDPGFQCFHQELLTCFSVGNSYKPSFATVSGKGLRPMEKLQHLSTK